MKISIVTATYNCASTVGDAVTSVQQQVYTDIEHIIQDGGSRDATVDIVNSMANEKTSIVSMPDSGIYDALNKGILRATGDVIGVMHSDDLFAHERVVERVAYAFEDPSVDAVFGDLHYVSAQDTNQIVRHWRAGAYSHAKLKRGWMPPHPTLYVRRAIFDNHGLYDTSFRIAADYDAILRWFGNPELKSIYLPEVLVKMRIGGQSNSSLRNIMHKSREDLRAIRSNNVGGVGVLALKNISKVGQFFLK